jgi:hypothetical protein
MAIIRISESARNAAANAIVDLLDVGAGANGTVDIYDGDMPAGPATAITTQNLLATLNFSTPAFGASASGVVTAASIASDASIDQTGTAAWARLKDADGTAVLDVDVGVTGSGATIELNTTSLVVAGELSILSMTFTMPAGA